MYSHEELKTLLSFLKSTGEGGLKKMLVGGKMTEPHLRLLLKIIRTASEEDFIKHFESDTFPKVKLGASELAIKEGFWKVCAEAFGKVGLLNSVKAA